jgi:hypothetical protein
MSGSFYESRTAPRRSPRPSPAPVPVIACSSPARGTRITRSWADAPALQRPRAGASRAARSAPHDGLAAPRCHRRAPRRHRRRRHAHAVRPWRSTAAACSLAICSSLCAVNAYGRPRFVGDAAASGRRRRPGRGEVRRLPTLRVDDALAAIRDRARQPRRLRRNAWRSPAAAARPRSRTSATRFSRVAPTVATAGNYNNEIGVPLTLARIGRRYALCRG